MSNKVNNRPIKYNRRKKDAEKALYSVRSLASEISGLVEGDTGYHAALKEVQRIVYTMQQFGGSEGTLKVAHESKEGMFFLTKAFMPTGTARTLYEKIRSNENLSEDEQIQLTDLFKEAIKLNKDGPEKEILLQRTQAEEDFISLTEEIMDIISKDIQLADSIMFHEEKIRSLKKYRDCLIVSLKQWRSEITDVLSNELILVKLTEIGLEKGYQLEDLLSDINGEKMGELMKELVQRDSLELIKSFENTLDQNNNQRKD